MEMALQVHEDGKLGACELFGLNTATFSTISKEFVAECLDCIPFHLQTNKDYVVFVPQDGSVKKFVPWYMSEGAGALISI